MTSSALEIRGASVLPQPVRERQQTIDDIETLVEDMSQRARNEYPAWWKRGQSEADGGVAAAFGGDPLLLAAIAAGLAADGARDRITPGAFGPFSARCRASIVRRMKRPARPLDIARRVKSPRRALLIYAACRKLVGRTAAGRVFVEDLGEALMIPVALLRQMKVRLPRPNGAG
jgi:hypothetical protein